MNVGFIGLGTMGGPICRNLIAKSDADVVVFDLDPAAVRACTAAGATAAKDIASLAAGADVIFTSLPLPAHVEQVGLGSGGVAESAREGTAWFDLSTNSPAVVRQLAAELQSKGIALLDAPVSGMAAGAEAGTLTVMVGGPKSLFDSHLPLLQTFGGNVIHIGDVGAGSIAKLTNNLLALCQGAGTAEGLMLGAAAGVEPSKLVDVVTSSSGNSVPFGAIAQRVLAGDFTPSFTVDLSYKDAHLALELADQLGVPTPLAAQSHNLLRMARGMGLGQADASAMMRVYEVGLDREVRASANGAGPHATPEPDRAAPAEFKKIGFIGVGTMGGRMCRNVIAKSGAEVIVFDLNADAVRACTDVGGRAAASLDDLIEQSDVLMTSLPMPRDVEAVALGPGGIAEKARPGTVWFDLSTSSLALTRRLAAELEQKGVTLLDAPISGTTAAADAGELTLMVGGDKAFFEAYLPLLGTIGKNVIHLGELGAGLSAKLVNNMLLFLNMAAATEVLSLGCAAGLDLDTLDAVISKSSGNSMGFWAISNRLRVPETPVQFALDLAYKDVHLALELADELSVPTPLGAETHNLMRMARGLGLGREDATELPQVYETVLRRELV